jgi:glycosyltransferase involved in cell wall biosynthesis
MSSVNVPRVSIIVPIYNGEKYLDESLKSVLEQTFQDWELLLVDDGSKDGSVALAQAYAKSQETRIRYLEHPGHVNRGQFATRILGARHARADIVAPLDQDDLWSPGYLEAHVALWDSLRAHGVVLSYGPSLYWHPQDATGSKDFVQSMPPGTPNVFAPGELLESYLAAGYANTPNPCSALIRRDVFEQVRHLEERAKGSPFEDQYLWWYIAMRWPVSIHANVWLRYRKHADNCYERVLASAKKFYQAELEFLQTVQSDLSRVFPKHGLLRNGKLGERINDLQAEIAHLCTVDS